MTNEMKVFIDFQHMKIDFSPFKNFFFAIWRRKQKFFITN